jgi:DNA modification methylase
MGDAFLIEYLNPRTLTPHPGNWRQHPERQRDALANSLTEHGWLSAPIWNRRTGHILDGHARVELAVSTEETAIPVRVIDVPARQEKRILASFDRIGELRERDDEALSALLAELAEDGGLPPGWDDADLAALIEPESGLLPGADPDAIPEDVETRCHVGDLWQLGQHRLLCGDSTKREDAERLMGQKKAAMVWADPPYGIDYVPNYSSSSRPYRNDRIAGDQRIDTSWLDLADALRLYLCTRWDVYPTWIEASLQWGAVKSLIVWDKGQGAAGNLDLYAPRHEFLIYVCRDDGALHSESRPDDVWQVAGFAQFTARRQEDVWGVHPTQKPVELVSRSIGHSSRPSEIVYDPFAGSGSAIVAAEQMGRACYAMEISAPFCDVCLARWEQATGQEAVLLERAPGSP